MRPLVVSIVVAAIGIAACGRDGVPGIGPSPYPGAALAVSAIA